MLSTYNQFGERMLLVQNDRMDSERRHFGELSSATNPQQAMSVYKGTQGEDRAS